MHHFSFEFVSWNIHRDKFISQRLFSNTDGICHVDLTFTTVILRFGTVASSAATWDNQFFLKSCHRAQEGEASEDGRNRSVKKTMSACAQPPLFHAHVNVCSGSWVFTGCVISTGCSTREPLSPALTGSMGPANHRGPLVLSGSSLRLRPLSFIHVGRE